MKGSKITVMLSKKRPPDEHGLVSGLEYTRGKVHLSEQPDAASGNQPASSKPRISALAEFDMNQYEFTRSTHLPIGYFDSPRWYQRIGKDGWLWIAICAALLAFSLFSAKLDATSKNPYQRSTNQGVKR